MQIRRAYGREKIREADSYEISHAPIHLNDPLKLVHRSTVDRETGVNYIFHEAGYAGGMTPLLGRDGKPVISPVIDR